MYLPAVQTWKMQQVLPWGLDMQVQQLQLYARWAAGPAAAVGVSQTIKIASNKSSGISCVYFSTSSLIF